MTKPQPRQTVGPLNTEPESTMNSTPPSGERQRLRLVGHCAGCSTPEISRGCVVVRRPSLPPGIAVWACPRCADELPASSRMRRLVDAAIARAQRMPHFCDVTTTDDLEVFTPVLAAAIVAARGATR
jgi:hypothetical protein